MTGRKWKRKIAALTAGIMILASAIPASAMDLSLPAIAADDSHRLETDAGWNYFLQSGGAASEMDADSAIRLDVEHSSCIRTYYEDKVPQTSIRMTDLEGIDDLQTDTITAYTNSAGKDVRFRTTEYVIYRTDEIADESTGAIAAGQRPVVTYENVYIYDPDDSRALTEGLPGFVQLDLTAEIRVTQKRIWNSGSSKTQNMYVGLERDFVGIPGVITYNCAQAEIRFSYYYHGTKTAYTVHSNQTWSDIDAAQGIGVRVQNVRQRYTTERTNILGFYRKSTTDIIQSTIASSVNETPESAYGFTYDSPWIILTVVSGQHAGSTITYGDPRGSYTYIGTSAYSLALPEMPEPKKSVSDEDDVTYNENEQWVEGEDRNTFRNGVGDAADHWTYTISQYIPEGMDTEAFYYKSMEFTDQIPEQLRIESVTVTDLTDTDRTDWFTIGTEDNEVSAKAADAALKNAGFYGNGFGNLLSLNITVGLKEGITKQELADQGLYDADKGVIRFTDIGTVHVVNAANGATHKNTNQVETYLRMPQPQDPVKTVSDEDGFIYDPETGVWSDGEESGGSENSIRDPAAHWTYEVVQELNAGPVYYSAFELTDELDPRLDILDVAILNAEGSGKDEWFTVTQTGNEVTAAAKEEALAGEDFYQTEDYRMVITVALKESVREEMTEQMEVNNTASVMIDHTWKASNETITRIDPPKQVLIRLTKRIKASEVHFAHGTPTFLLKVYGTDAKRQSHTYYAMVAFEEGELDKITDEDGFAEKTAEFLVPAGVYFGAEEQSARYRLERICDIQNGVIAGTGSIVRFDLTDVRIDEAGCTFENRCFEYQDYSDSSGVENRIPGRTD